MTTHDPGSTPPAAPDRSDLGEGVAAFRAGSMEAAHAAFLRAHRRDPRDPRAMSWYGLTLVLVEKNLNLGISLCDQALRTTGPEPELLLNLARAHLAMNQRERAVKAIARGLEAHPQHPALRAAVETMGSRSAPVLPFLDRGNPLNRLLGRWRHRWRRRRSPASALSPLTLGLLPEADDQLRSPDA